jgi:hypothetical protein
MYRQDHRVLSLKSVYPLPLNTFILLFFVFIVPSVSRTLIKLSVALAHSCALSIATNTHSALSHADNMLAIPLSARNNMFAQSMLYNMRKTSTQVPFRQVYHFQGGIFFFSFILLILYICKSVPSPTPGPALLCALRTGTRLRDISGILAASRHF